MSDAAVIGASACDRVGSRAGAVRHVYLHVPFCSRRCSYCDFSIAVRRTVPWRAFADTVAREVEVRAVAQPQVTLDTLYLGGGTPSHLGADGVQATLDALRPYLTWDATTEVTLEANPEDITVEAVRSWKAAGINRLSIGIQSFDDRVLTWMHRVHDAARAEAAVEAARAGGIDAFSVDLIFAAPERLARDWSHDVSRILSLGADHVSLYGLTIEPHTPLGRWHARGEEQEADESHYETEFLEAHERLTTAGYEHYEVSNFGRTGRRARHNSAYWCGVPYLGLGPAAHGFDGTERRWNLSAFTAWDEAVNSTMDPVEGRETLSHENRIAESVYLGLRTIDGLEVNADEVAHVRRWREEGWVTIREHGGSTRLVCTAQGWLRLDALAADLTAFRSGS